VWRPISPEYGNVNVLICIFASFLKQCALKLWWLWIYQNNVVKRAYAIVVQWWMIFYEVYFREVKNEQYCIVWVGRRYKLTICFWSKIDQITWRSASFTFFSANFNCSSDRVMPVYLHPVCLTSWMANVPQPHPISRTSCFSSILALVN
jgi:hypothetical protein